MANEKLIARKQEWARQGRLLTGKGADPQTRLPPGQRLVKDWPVLDLGEQPAIPPERFQLELNGAVQTPQRLSYREFMDLPQVESMSDMHCVTQWSRYDNAWTGVAAATIIALANPRPEARHVVFHAHDGYTTNVRLDQFDQPDVFLVHQWQGQPIDRRHGGPVRVLIPRLYLWKSAKWVRRIEFREDDAPGFWEVRGYHNNADHWNEERYS
jgi:DMSO/TMAO reductase YedYZ molybdopterin-dependent catalytic subunit